LPEERNLDQKERGVALNLSVKDCYSPFKFLEPPVEKQKDLEPIATGLLQVLN